MLKLNTNMKNSNKWSYLLVKVFFNESQYARNFLFSFQMKNEHRETKTNLLTKLVLTNYRGTIKTKSLQIKVNKKDATQIKKPLAWQIRNPFRTMITWSITYFINLNHLFKNHYANLTHLPLLHNKYFTKKFMVSLIDLRRK